MLYLCLSVSVTVDSRSFSRLSYLNTIRMRWQVTLVKESLLASFRKFQSWLSCGGLEEPALSWLGNG